jgi:uncharacterized membrane protein YfhO
MSELEAYARALERGPDRSVRMRWEGPGRMLLRAELRDGESVVVQESYDPAWRASSGGRLLRIEKDAAGLMRVYAPPGEQEIEVRFELPTENRIGYVVTGITAIASILLAAARRHPI